jgi:Uma2 family endonuclease
VNRVLTYEEWLKLPEVDGIEDVVNGEIQEMPPNRILHADTGEILGDLLKAGVNHNTTQARVSTIRLLPR